MANEGDVNIKELIAAATKELKTKNSELLGKLKKTKEEYSMFEGIDVEKLLKDQKALAKLNKDKDKEKGEYKKLYEQQQSQHEEAMLKLQEELKETKEAKTSLVKTTHLKNALVKQHVDPILLEAAESVLLPNLAVDDEGKVMVGDKSVSDFVSDWTKSDVGKRFVSNGNSGGGANGSGNKGTPEADFFNKESKNYSVTEQAKIANNNPDLYKNLKGKFA